MRDIIDKLISIDKKYSYKAFLEHYVPSPGYYVKVDDLNNVTYYKFSGEEDDPFLRTDEYKFFKDRSFFEGMLNANKSIDSANKQIHSVTPNAMIFKYGIFSNKKIINKELTVIDIIERHINLMNIINDGKLDTNKLLDTYTNLFNKIKDDLKDVCDKDDKILIFLDKDIEDYKHYYDKYLEDKVFIRDDTVITIDKTLYGMPWFSNSLNDKKPTSSINPYNNVPFRLGLKETKLLTNITKVKSSIFKEILLDEEDLYSIDLNIRTNPKTKSRAIFNYDMNIEDNEYFYPLNRVTLLQTKYANRKPKKATLSRRDLLTRIDIVFNPTPNAFLFNSLLRIKDDNYDPLKEKCRTVDVFQALMSHKDILKYYFKENGDLLIDKELINIMFIFYLEFIKTNHSMNKLREVLDFMITVLDYVNKDGGYITMPEIISDIWDNLKNGLKDHEYFIKSNEEFFYVAGQLLSALASLSESGNNTGLLIQDVLSVKNSIEIKDRVIEKYIKYAYKIEKGSFLNVLYHAVLVYEIDKDIKIKNFQYKYFYNAGLVGNNIMDEIAKKEQ